MRSKRWSLVAVISLAVACGGSTKQAAPPAKPAEPAPAAPVLPVEVEAALPAIPSSPAPAPDGLFVVAHAGDPSALVAALGTFADAIQPGMKAMFTTELLIATAASEGIDLRGVDLTRPVRVLLLDPARYPQPVVAVVGVADEAALRAAAAQLDMRMQVHGGFAAIGTTEALTAAGGYALTTLAIAPTPTVPTMEIDVAAVMQRHGAGIDQLVEQATADAEPEQRAMMIGVSKMGTNLLAQIDRLVVTAELAGQHASIVTRMSARSGTALATFIGNQGPATFAMVEQMPPGLFAMGGRLDLAQIWTTMGAMLEPMMVKTWGDGGPAMWKQWTELQTGETAASVEIAHDAFGMSGSWEVTKADAAATLWGSYLAAVAKAPQTQVAIKQSSSKHRAVKMSLVTVTPTKDVPDDQRAFYQRFGGKLMAGFSVVDQRLLFALGTDANARMKALIDVAKGAAKKQKRPSGLAPVITEAKRRGESYLFAFDLEALKTRFGSMLGNGPGPTPSGLNEPGVFAIGAADGALTWRVTLPAAQAKILTTM